jgi:Uma2 family endonuclease
MAVPLRDEERYTFEDWLSWDEDIRVEILDGKHIMMAPPSLRHQAISVELSRQLSTFLKGKPCKVYTAPVGVHMEESSDTVFEPDIIVVCDGAKLDGKVCNGAPDLIVEILSPSTARHDRMIKYNFYQRAGVREYWIVDPDTNTVQVCVLDKDRYYTMVFGDDDVAPITVLPGCEIILSDVFAE